MSDNTTAPEKKKNLFFKERIYPILFMAAVTAVFIAAVSGIYLSTADLVVLNETIFQKKAVLYAAGIEAPEDSFELEKLYNRRIKETELENETVFQILDDSGDLEGFAVYGIGPGLWGEIQAVMGFENDGKTLTGLEFIKQNETPGLGARITEDWFKEQFRGKQGPFTMVPEGTSSTSPNQFDSITGATRTSTAVRTIINNTLKKADSIAKEVR